MKTTIATIISNDSTTDRIALVYDSEARKVLAADGTDPDMPETATIDQARDDVKAVYGRDQVWGLEMA